MSLGSPALNKSLDRWLTEPDDEKDSKLYCRECGQQIYPGERIYNLDDDFYCSDCAHEWLEQFETEATEEQCYGDV